MVMRKVGMQWCQWFERRKVEGNGSMVMKEGGMQWFQWFERRRGELNGLNGLRGKGVDAKHGFHCLSGEGGNYVFNGLSAEVENAGNSMV
jgi:hypothetical protein